ncbi:hypothetical protein WJX74_002224 [Apatococcus lobatus]|uniref:Uncharacterized protein n=1 Tax=Apatococcus lobatus TaxID=904363 RepID=A0AAW1Q7M4_9CHLO
MRLDSVWRLFKTSGPDATSTVGAAGPYTLNAATGKPILSPEERSEFKVPGLGQQTAVQGHPEEAGHKAFRHLRSFCSEGHTAWDALLSTACSAVGQVILTYPYQAS